MDAETIDRLRAALIRISRRVDRQVSGGGLTSTQLSVLASVSAHGPIVLGELADVEGINPTMLSRVVGKLEDAGFVQREPDRDDRRVVRVAVTPAGVRLRKRLLADRSRLLAERLAGLGPEAIEALVAAMPSLEMLADELAPRR
ncbi:MAG: MarR family transcriptional regulator [Actinomycetota bacterium]|nr:MarR family transcriptional regulator [Actinomycetota bacterium]